MHSKRELLTGFTIIELLVVVSIAALISSIILVQFQQTRSRAHDTEREGEINSLQKALALYVINNRSYPIYSGPLTGVDIVSDTLINNEVITQIPVDPINSGDYRYIYDSTSGSTYTLTYYLETDSISGKTSGIQTIGP